MSRADRAMTVGCVGFGMFMFLCIYLPPGLYTPFVALVLALLVAIGASWGLSRA